VTATLRENLNRALSNWKRYLPGGEFWQQLTTAAIVEFTVLIGFSFFFLAYGLIPYFGGDVLGLVGADEPRYAQVAREMLARNDFITPILYGKPWLEKPALYYWRAMFSFKDFGVHDWAARIPSAEFAFILVILIYLHMRRFRPGGQLDAALITVSSAAVIGFARGASTDMQLAAPFCIGMLGWYAWYETDRKFWLFDLYFFGGAATLAKGPVAPFLAICIIVLFAALRREWSLLRRTIWIPGILLYLAMVLPWFVAVQHRNPQFLRVFFLEQNLERFSINRYHHQQPLWYYIPVAALAVMPWVALAARAFWDAVRTSIAEWKTRRHPVRYVGNPRPGDAFPEFLVLWAIFPILFFSFSQSKLPGYILPSVPPIAILCGDFLNRMRKRGLGFPLVAVHSLMVGILVAGTLLLPQIMVHSDRWPPAHVIASAAAVGLAVAIAVLVTVLRFGISRLRIATLIPVALILVFLLSSQNGKLLNQKYSARTLAHELESARNAPHKVAVFDARRDIQYGLSFYLNEHVTSYRHAGVPTEAHLLVVRNYKQVPKEQEAKAELKKLLAGRQYEPLFRYPPRDLTVYRVDAKSPPQTNSATPPPRKRSRRHRRAS
jgi:4-amino-4-deoxy-L-arabinose transferase-like glycosyltransferase